MKKLLKSTLFLLVLVAAFFALPQQSELPLLATSSDPLADYRNQQKELYDQLKDMEKEIKGLEADVKSRSAQIQQISLEVTMYQQQAALAQAAIDETNIQIADTEAGIEITEQRLAEQRSALANRLYNLYVDGDITVLDVIFEAASFHDFLVLYDMMGRIVEQDNAMIDGINEDLAYLQEAKALLEQRRADLEVLLADYNDTIGSLVASQARHQELIDESKMSIAELEELYAEMEREEEELKVLIRSLLANSNSNLSFGGEFIWPLPSGHTTVPSEYKMRFHPVLKVNKWHTGIDIGAPNGTSIYAAADGEVIFVGRSTAWGNYVMVDHGDGIVTLYAHMSKTAAEVDTYVFAGDTIGYVGSTGYSTGNHLHFEVRVNGAHTSPWKYLKK